MRWVLIEYNQCLYKKGKFGYKEADMQMEDTMKTHRRRQLCHWSVMCVQVKQHGKCQKLAETGKNSPLQPSERPWPCWHLDVGLLASRTVRLYSYAMLTHLSFDTCYESPRKLIMIPSHSEIATVATILTSSNIWSLGRKTYRTRRCLYQNTLGLV